MDPLLTKDKPLFVIISKAFKTNANFGSIPNLPFVHWLEQIMQEKKKYLSESPLTQNVVLAPNSNVEKGLFRIDHSDIQPVPSSLIIQLSLAEFIEWFKNYLTARGANLNSFNKSVKLLKQDRTVTITLSMVIGASIECIIADASNNELEIRAVPVPTLWGGLPSAETILNAEMVQRAMIYYLMSSIQEELNGQSPEIVNISIDIPALRRLIVETFDSNELANLCQDLNISSEDLGNHPREGKVRELIEYCQRHDQLNELLTNLKRVRPRRNWDDIQRTELGLR